VGIMSYNGQLHFGLIGDYDAMADLDSLALDLEASIGDLSDAVPKPRRRKGEKATKKAAAKAKAKGASNGAKSTSRKAAAKRDSEAGAKR
jgi:diacylglycerol O-acyltransferase